jgi:hypothetical protein
MNVEQTAGKSPFLGVILIVRQFIIGRLASDIIHENVKIPDKQAPAL